MMRDSRADAAYFDSAVSAVQRGAVRHEREIDLPPEKHRYPAFRAVAANNAMSLRAREFSAAYSRGDGRDELMSIWDSWTVAAEAAAVHKRADDAAHLRAAQDEPGTIIRLYVDRLWLVATALALAVDEAAWARVVVATEGLASDRLVASLLATRTPDTTVAPELWYPKRFGPLGEAFDTAKNSRPAIIGRYLDTWYRRVKGMDWWDGHEYVSKLHYVGYWAFEAAGVVAALGIDEACFRDQEYYPAGLTPV